MTFYSNVQPWRTVREKPKVWVCPRCSHAVRPHLNRCGCGGKRP